MTKIESMLIFREIPTYETWCEANRLDPDNDENYSAYCEWKANA
jgi:hypothetical protein